MGDHEPIRVLVADDEPLVRAGLAMLIDAEEDLVVVGQAGSGFDAVELARTARPDVVVMDVRMPGSDGVYATRHLVSEEFVVDQAFTTAVLMLTTFNDDTAVHDALRAGASGFLLKNTAPSALCEAVRHVAAGHAWLDPVVARRLLAEFASQPDCALPVPAELARLTLRETEVLILAAHGLPNAEIAAHLVISEATVKTHVSRVLTKLDLRDRSQAVTTAYKCGLVHPDDRPPHRAR